MRDGIQYCTLIVGLLFIYFINLIMLTDMPGGEPKSIIIFFFFVNLRRNEVFM